MTGTARGPARPMEARGAPITPVILCGGSGTRLWPLSRKSFPKQFASILEPRTLFEAAAMRLSGSLFAPPIVVTNSDFRFIVVEQLAEAGIEPGPILIEPEARSTAPAILAAAILAARSDPATLLLVSPSDHAISDPAAFRACVEAARPTAEAGRIVTFGIAPTRAETGYGWLQLSGDPSEGTAPLLRFVEKPDAAAAQAMLAAGGYLWNAGIFLFRADTILDAFRAHAPTLLDPVRRAVDGAVPDLGFLRLDPAPWSEAPEASIDYAVMEHATNLSVAPFGSGWSDLGDWTAIAREMEADASGNARSGAVTAIECRDSLLRSESEGVELVALGLSEVIAVAMPDAVLVADRARAQDLKLAVAALKAKGAKQAEAFAYDHRPWGHFERLATGENFQVKRIVVHPGARLSLQSHRHRSEHWVVVCGTARVTIGETVSLVGENESVYVPVGTRHRLENPGRDPMILIEVQTGAYLGEDDIVRHEDAYARGPGE